MADIMSHIVFTGICLFLRPEEGKPPTAAVFMEGRRNLDGTKFAHPHHVFLVVNTSEHTIVETPAPLAPKLPRTQKVGDFGKLYDVYTLNDRRIEVTSHVIDPSLDDLVDDSAVPHMKRVWPRMIGGGHKEVDDLHSPKRTEKLRGRVNSRLELPAAGELHVSFANLDQWRFAPGVLFRSRVEGSIPQEVTLEQTLLNGALELQVYDINEDNKLQATLTITPRFAGSKKVTVLLANVPPHDLFPSDVCATEVDCTQTPDNICCRDHHFQLYYRAFENPPRNPPLPEKVETALASRLPRDGTAKLFRVGGANCGPAQQP